MANVIYKYLTRPTAMDKVIIKRIDKALPLPKYETHGAVGFDVLARVETEVLPGKVGLIPANVIVKVPDGYMLCLASRGSTPIKKGLSTPHGIGVVDLDYHGPEDELKIQVYNFTDTPVIVNRGDRVAQGIFVRVDRFEFEEVEHIEAVSRGGFGSTG
jgi:dUTP pyrophosphatase